MKQNIHHLYYLFSPRGLISLRRSVWIIINLLLCSTTALAQEQTPPSEEFPIGSSLSGIPWRRTQLDYYTSFDSSSMNTIIQYSNDDTKSRLNPYNLLAYNMDNNDWIMYYATCYYSKWEAEQNQTNDLRVGVKHKGGAKVFWSDAWCWSTRNVIAPACSLVFGPHYRQDNRYKSWQHDPDRHNVKYYVRYKMALDNPQSENPERPVCNIKVVYRFQREHTQGQSEPKKDTLFLSRTLTVGDFPDSGKFNYFYFTDPEPWYKYPDQFWLPKDAGKLLYIPEDSVWYNDVNDDIGIQFFVEWLVEDVEESGLTLYVDNIEVYDEDWKENFIEDPIGTVQDIQEYAQNYCNWPNLKYWIGHDEPWSLDAYTPIKTVDAILKSINAPSLMTVFYPYWNIYVNSDSHLVRYYNTVQPEKLIIDFYPIELNFKKQLYFENLKCRLPKSLLK